MCVSQFLEIIFSSGTGEIKIKGVKGDSFANPDLIAAKGPTCQFTSQLKPGFQFPDIDTLCLVREIVGNGYRHIFLGRYEQLAVNIMGVANEFSFNINNLLNFAQRTEIEEYSETRTMTDHINAALEESGAFTPGNALSLLNLQKIAGEDPAAYPFPFAKGTLEKFLDAIVLGKGRWKINPSNITDFASKTSGVWGSVEIVLDGVTTNRAAQSKLDPGKDHCRDASYLKVIGQVHEERQSPPANRIIVRGRNSRKPIVAI